MQQSSPPPSGPIPLHLVALDADGHLLRPRRGPGRPRKVRPAPSADQRSYDDELRGALEAHVATDPLVRAVGERATPVEVLRRALVETAREAASIAFEIAQRPLGREAERARSRRLDALVAIGKVQAQIVSEETDAPPPGVLDFLRDVFLRDVGVLAREVLGEESATSLVERIRERLDGQS